MFQPKQEVINQYMPWVTFCGTEEIDVPCNSLDAQAMRIFSTYPTESVGQTVDWIGWFFKLSYFYTVCLDPHGAFIDHKMANLHKQRQQHMSERTHVQ